MDVLEALAQLDPENDDLWTANGVPRVEAVSAILGREVKRQEITDASHDFTRDIARQMQTPDPGADIDPDDDGEAQPDPEDVPLAASNPGEESDPLEDYGDASGQLLEDNPATAAEIQAAELNDAANAKMEEARAAELEIDRLAKVKAQALREADVLVQQRERVLPSPTDAQATRTYLDRQAEIRMEKHMRRQTVLKHLDGSEIAKGAPIDQAMARKRKRGGQRPNRTPAPHLNVPR